MTDYYEVLGVKKDASKDDIKKAYKKLAQKYHPDRYTGDDADTKFKEINKAYQTLSDEQKRAAYDNPAPEGFQFRSSNMGGHGGMDDMIRSMMEEMMGRRTYGSRQQYQMANVSITLEEAFTGTTRTLNGNAFNIPAGARNGMQLMLRDPQIGDIIIVINISRHAKFRVSQDDLLMAVQIDAIEAMLGVECNLTNIDGNQIKVKIPAGIQNGKLVRVAGKGMPNPEIPGQRGDLLVQVGISIPNDLTEEEKQAIMNVRHRKGFDA